MVDAEKCDCCCDGYVVTMRPVSLNPQHPVLSVPALGGSLSKKPSQVR